MKKKNPKKKKSNQEFWEFAKKVSEEVAQWPEWKRNIKIGYSYNTSQDIFLSSKGDKNKDRVNFRSRFA